MKKKNLFIIISIMVVLTVFLIPVRFENDDGGSFGYKSLVYKVTKIHRFAPNVDGVKQ